MARARARRAALGRKDNASLPGEPAPLQACAEGDEGGLAPAALASALATSEQAPGDNEAAPAPSLPSKRSPPVLMLVVDEEEDVEFCTSTPALQPHDADQLEFSYPANDVSTQAPDADSEPPFDPPDLDELLTLEVCDDDEEPPFDPIEAEDLLPPSLSAPTPSLEAPQTAPANENKRGATLGPVRNPVPDGAREQPAPAIRIHFSWDRPEAGEFFSRVASDRRLSRTEIAIARGGLDGAAIQYAAHQRPDIVIVDTTLRGAAMLASLDRLMHAAGAEAKVIVIGAINDVTLLRELAQHGVDEYLVWPIEPEEVAGAICAMFAEVDKARVIAVTGARGGIGASTVARNLAWCIAERRRLRTTLVDLDLPFGTAAFDLKFEPPSSLADVLAAGEHQSDVALERVAIRYSDRLSILPASADPRHSADLAAETGLALIAAARRLSSFVVLDLPHLWEPWVKQALLGADEIVLVSSPDIASLRNTDNIAKLIKNERKCDPTVVVSTAGMAKRPEVPLKEFAEALSIAPQCVLGFEPNIFGAASITGQMLGEVAPDSKPAMMIDQLATLFTGREPIVALRPEPLVFETAIEDEAPPAPDGSADPFEHALVNPVALLAPDDVPEPEDAAADHLPPLELQELAPVEPAYIAHARAAALEHLDAIEGPQRSRAVLPLATVRLSPFASAAFGFAVTAAIVGAYLFAQWTGAPAPAAAQAAVHVPASAATPPPAPQQQQQQLETAYRQAVAALESGAAAEAAAQLQHLADAGFVTAQYRLAKMYERGEGVAPDVPLARQWTERAAAGGNRNAMYDLGVYYARGEGGPRDEAGAFRWFQQAAELGLADSQYNLAVLYEQGRGVDADLGEALFWFMLAAEQGDADAAERAAALEAELTPFEIEQARARLAVFQPSIANPLANGDFAPAETAPRADDDAPPAAQPDADTPA